MPDGPREYDTSFTASIEGLPARRRLGFDVSEGIVTRFLVQLEYQLDPLHDSWVPVVRYDHDEEGGDEATHDVTEEGLHIDIFKDGQKVDSHELSPPLDANSALNVAEEHLAEHVDGYVRRFERWHGIRPSDP